MIWLNSWVAYLRSLWRKPPPRLCAYCSGPMPKDAPPDKKYCKDSHKTKAKAKRNHGSTHPGRARKARLNAAWTLNSTYEDHAASCARKTASGGAYDTLGDALGALRMLRDSAPDGAPNASVYHCLVCSKWHLTGGRTKENA